MDSDSLSAHKMTFKFTVPVEPENRRAERKRDSLFPADRLGGPIEFEDNLRDIEFSADLVIDKADVQISFSSSNFSKTDSRKSSRTEKLYLRTANIHVALSNIPNELVTCFERSNAPTLDKAAECNKLVYHAASIGLKAYCNLIRYANNEKRQYSVLCPQTDLLAAQCLAHDFDEVLIGIDNNPTFCWRQMSSNGSYKLTTELRVLGNTESSPISISDIPEMKSFIESGSHGNSANEFLVNARKLWLWEQYRSSVLEAHGAIEFVVNNIKDDPDCYPSALSEKLPHVNYESLKRDVKLFGLTKSVRYLLPLAMPELLNNNVLSDVLILMELRQNIVHNGQRELDSLHIYRLITSSERFCDLLKHSG